MSNQETVQRYLDEKEANGIRPDTIRLDLCVLKRLNQSLRKPFKEATKEDMIRFFNELAREGFTRLSIHTYKKKVKVFYNWLYDLDYREYPPCVKWIRSSNPRSTKSGGLELPVKPEDLLTKEDVKTLINTCDHPRDQALIALLYETAARAEEVVKLRVGSIKFDEYGGKVTLEGDTGARIIRLVDSVPYLQVWLNVHPYLNNLGAPLWPKKRRGLGKEGIGYANIRKLVVGLKKASGIKKPVRPHLFRHARLTELAKYLPEQKLKIYAGWTAGSRMAGTYVHLSGKDLDQDILELHGIKPKEPERPLESGVLAPRKCVRCKNQNPATAQYCQFCGIILDEKLALEKINEEQTIEKQAEEIEELKRARDEQHEKLVKYYEFTKISIKKIDEQDEAIKKQKAKGEAIEKELERLRKLVEEKMG